MTFARAALALSLLSVTAWAADELTPVGAERDGNADGTIPAWTGGLDGAEWAADGQIVDPFAGDRPLFTITSANYRQYSSRLSAGHQALFARDQGYSMPVFAARRSVSFPEAIYRATARNAASARLKGADSIEGATLGFPFREPRSGVELLWNHRLRYRGDSAEWHYARALVSTGKPDWSAGVDRVLYGYANIGAPGEVTRHSLVFTALKPAGDFSDIAVLWRQRVNEFTKEREIWTYGSDGRVWRNPPIGDDDVGMFSAGVRYWDMLDMFNGGFFHYTLKLLGKRELYVPYNSFRLADGSVPVRGLLRQDHVDPAGSRYELHRVWVVEATLRPGERHSVARRTLYLDEDSWSILLADGYDADGKLSRFQEGHLLLLSPVRAVDYAPIVTYDLANRRYFVDRLLTRAPRLGIPGIGPGDFTPDRLVAWYQGAAKSLTP